jgi:dTDP-4-dehydrorhamnose reductase
MLSASKETKKVILQMRVTIFGATGLLGKALLGPATASEWEGNEVSGLGSKDADIRDSEQVLGAVQRTRPDWIVLAAAYTDVDGCETNRELAFDVNCRGAVNVSKAAKQHGARLLLVSTDYVFDGKSTVPYEADALRAPRSVYGQSKADAEAQVGEILPECCIVRTSWLFGAGGKCFPDTILKLAEKRPEIDVVSDQRGSPTYTVDLARAIARLSNVGASGIVHATNRGQCSWFEFAVAIVHGAGLKTIVRPTTSARFVRPAERPQYSVLSPRSLEKYGIALPTWQEALRNYLRERSIPKLAGKPVA